MTSFISPNLIKLSKEDFVNNYQSLKDIECAIILFYVDNDESKKIAPIFAEVAELVSGIKFGSVKMEPSDFLIRNKAKTYPFILGYRNKSIATIYNDKASVEALINWSLTLACY